MAGCGQARNFCMKKSVNNFKIVAWVVAIFSASLVIFWLNMPRFLRDTIEYRLKVYNAELKSITIEKINPWTMCLSGFNALFYDGNVSFKKLDVRYEPLDLSEGKIHAISLSSPCIDVDLPKFIERMNSLNAENKNESTIQSVAEDFLANPKLQHLRLRNASVSLASEQQVLRSNLEIEGDFHPGLSQLRMDGNLSGLPWLSDLTMVQEGSDLFLGAVLHFADVSLLPQAINSIGVLLGQGEGDQFDFSEWLEIDQGKAKGQWTGRVEEDGILDQFMDFNVSNLVLQAMGVTLNIPQAILFLTPRTPTSIESNFYANLNWGDNLDLKGLKVSANMEDGKPSLSFRVQSLRTMGVLPMSEIFGLVVDGVELAYGEDDTFIGIRKATVRFSSIHLQEGLFNLYNGDLSLEWLGEDRFQIELLKADGSLPTLGLNLHNFGYAGEIALDSLPKLENNQNVIIEEIFLGEDQKIEDLKIQFKLDSLHRIELSKVEMSVNGVEFSLDPANFVVEMPKSSQERVALSFLESELQFADYQDFSFKNIQGNIKLNSLDPLDSNGSQSIRFDLYTGEQVLENGVLRCKILPTGEKIIESLDLNVFGGLISLGKTQIDEDFGDLELSIQASELKAQEIISLFEDLDAQMEGNLSGIMSIRNDPLFGWDFYGGALSLEASDSARLSFNTNGMLTEGLEPQSSEYKNMYLLENALQNLDLEALNIIFKIMDDGERLVEMNVRGESEVDGKMISVEYRPKIIGGLNALIQQTDLSKWGISP